GRIGEPAVAELLTCLKENDNVLRVTAIDALRGIGADAKKAVPTLIDIGLQDNYFPARRNAIVAIASIEPEKLADLFGAIKKLDDEKARITAYQSLYVRLVKKGGTGMLTVPAKVALPHLIDATKDGSANVRLVGVQGLATLGAEAKEAAPALNDLARDDPD